MLALSVVNVASSSEPALVLLGDVMGYGDVKIDVASEKWVGLKGRTFPVIPETHLRTNDGMSSVNLRDGVIIEVGRDSDIVISGKRGDCSVRVNRGVVGFMVPDGIKFSVITPTMNIEFPQAKALFRQTDISAEGSFTGAVAYNGRETRIMSVSETGLVLNRTAFKNRAVIPIENVRVNLDSPSSP